MNQNLKLFLKNLKHNTISGRKKSDTLFVFSVHKQTLYLKRKEPKSKNSDLNSRNSDLDSRNSVTSNPEIVYFYIPETVLQFSFLNHPISLSIEEVISI